MIGITDAIGITDVIEIPDAIELMERWRRAVVPARRCRKAIGARPVCEQQIGKMRFYRIAIAKKKSQTGTCEVANGFVVKKREQKSAAVFNSSNRRDYQAYRTNNQDSSGSMSSMSILIGAGIIAAAILLSTLLSAIGNRYVGFESPVEDTAWLVDRVTGRVYKCRAPDPGRANCRAEIATGSIPDKPKP